MLNYLRNSFARKKARRQFQKYPFEKKTFSLSKDGYIEFAVWKNPLVRQKEIHQKEVDFFRKFVKPGGLSIDIGANIGDTTVPIALATGPKGLTIGFEPNPHIFEIFEVNASLNPDKTKIITAPFAITEKEGEFFYSSSEASLSNGKISSEGSKQGYVLDTKIKGMPLEKYLQDNYPQWLKNLSFIKVDVEGYDKTVLESIRSLLEKYKPTIIAECFFKTDKAYRFGLFDYLDSLGYELHYFADFEEDTQTILLSREDMMKWKHFDFFAVPKDHEG